MFICGNFLFESQNRFFVLAVHSRQTFYFIYLINSMIQKTSFPDRT